MMHKMVWVMVYSWILQVKSKLVAIDKLDGPVDLNSLKSTIALQL